MVQVRRHFLKAARLIPVCFVAQSIIAQRSAVENPKFYADDPLPREPPPLNVGKIANRNINDYYDFFQEEFFPPDKGEMKSHDGGPSQAVNTLGEVPDSAWFTNRIGSRPISIEALARGPGEGNAPAMDKPWMVISGKNQGVTPGLVIRDSKGRKYFLKFDPLTNPEMASAADVLGSKFFYDLGYNAPENYIVNFGRDQLRIDEKSTYRTPQGNKRAMTDRDVNDILAKTLRGKDGRYRGLASFTIPGEIIGPYRYYGTRTDDPNDIVDHENRRDLRGLYVFAAWLNHTDSKSINSLDSVVEEDGRRFVKHFLLDFGAILGSDSDEAKNPRRGNVYVFAWKPAAEQFLSLGLYAPKWMRADYPDMPEVGRLEYETFDPEHWRSNYRNPAFELHNPVDAYWAAKKVMAFSDEAIRAVVRTAQYSEPRAAEWVTKCLIERRNKIGRAFFSDVLALDDFALRGGKLVFDNLAASYGFQEPPGYSVQWFEYDNRAGTRKEIPGAATFDLPSLQAEYLAASIYCQDPRKTVTVYLHAKSIIGIDRTW